MTFLGKIDPLILDTLFVCVVVLIAALGAIRGIKKVSINVGLLSVSLFLAFCPWTKSLKTVVADKLFNADKLLPAGSSNIVKFAVSFIMPLLSALVIFALFYLLMLMIYILIDMLVKKKMKQNVKQKSVVGRVFAGIISFVYGSALVIVLLISLNTKMVGLEHSVDDSTIVKFVVNSTEEALNKINKNLDKQIRIKVYFGDVLYKVDDETIETFEYFDEKSKELVENKNYIEDVKEVLTKDEAKIIIEERIQDLYKMAILTNNVKKESKDLDKKYVKVADELIFAIHGTMQKYSMGKIEYSINEYLKMTNEFKLTGLSDKTMGLFKEIIVGK